MDLPRSNQLLILILEIQDETWVSTSTELNTSSSDLLANKDRPWVLARPSNSCTTSDKETVVPPSTALDHYLVMNQRYVCWP